MQAHAGGVCDTVGKRLEIPKRVAPGLVRSWVMRGILGKVVNCHELWEPGCWQFDWS